MLNILSDLNLFFPTFFSAVCTSDHTDQCCEFRARQFSASRFVFKPDLPAAAGEAHLPGWKQLQLRRLQFHILLCY